MTKGRAAIQAWFDERGWTEFDFQKRCWNAYLRGEQGLLNAPTGSGKTYAMWFGPVMEWINEQKKDFRDVKPTGLQVLWLTPLRALASDIARALQDSCDGLGLPWTVETRTSDTSQAVKQRQLKRMPQALITTPESLHVLLSMSGGADLFKHLRMAVVDEWHELLGSKRGTQTELGLAHLRSLRPKLRTWGISATIGNLEEAKDVLLGAAAAEAKSKIVRVKQKKLMTIESVLPESIERFPWSGHLGAHMVEKIIPLVHASKTTLIFTNVRSQTEIWYHRLLEAAPELAGQMAIHHGSLDTGVRHWVEDALRRERLRAVVCTSTLDLGVDFSPVETVIQVGSPKGVARFLQRAGRSGHSPGATSRMYFVPTNALELVEAAAIQEAIKQTDVEARKPIINPLDVLVQWLTTLASGGGFKRAEALAEVRGTHAFKDISDEEFDWVLDFITTGGRSLHAYDEYKKVVLNEDGDYAIADRRTALRHRMQIGTITADAALKVQFLSGKKLGTIEEGFISGIKPGKSFWFAGRNLELVRIKEMTVFVKKSSKKDGRVPSWQGGRIPLSTEVSEHMRMQIDAAAQKKRTRRIEMRTLEPLLNLQRAWSLLPEADTLLIEKTFSREGCHVFFYPFEGRLVHEGMGAVLAYRIAQMQPISFSIAMNDYGFEILSEDDIPIEEALLRDVFSSDNLVEDIYASVNATEMARRRFREIARVAGLVFQGYPGQKKLNRHLQASSGLLFDVFEKYDGGNLLLRQAYTETLAFQLEEKRLRRALDAIRARRIELRYPERFTPFAFPIMVDRLREKLGSERVTDRIQKMKLQLEEAAG